QGRQGGHRGPGGRRGGQRGRQVAAGPGRGGGGLQGHQRHRPPSLRRPRLPRRRRRGGRQGEDAQGERGGGRGGAGQVVDGVPGQVVGEAALPDQGPAPGAEETARRRLRAERQDQGGAPGGAGRGDRIVGSRQSAVVSPKTGNLEVLDCRLPTAN